METTHINGISDIIDDYDAFILDLWGVLHDGESAWPGAIECLRELQGKGKQTCLLSNAPQRAELVVEKMAAMGITRDLYTHILTSGEATHQALKTGKYSFGETCYHFGDERDRSVLDGLPINIVGDVPDAAFILNSGTKEDHGQVADYADRMDRALEIGLPMICANPDIIVHIGERLRVCAGALAGYYADKGGQVYYQGKPHNEVYQTCFELLAGYEKNRILAVGDSLRTDIAGAGAAGIDSALTLCGIHRDELGFGDINFPDLQKREQLIKKAVCPPKFTILSFKL